MRKSVYLDLLVGEKREHKGPWLCSSFIGGIRYSQKLLRRGKKLQGQTVPISFFFLIY